MPADPSARSRSRSSRALHRLGDASAHAAAGLTAAAFAVGWVAFGLATGFPEWWATTLYAASSAVTLVMVFAIQHTQSRQQMATQRKLDEILRCLPGADDQLIAAEIADDHELAALGELNVGDRQRARQDGAS